MSVGRSSALAASATSSQPRPTTHERAEQYQPAYPVRMAMRVLDCHRAALRDPHQREPRQSEFVDDRLQVGDEGLQRDIRRILVGQTTAALVVSHQRPVPGQVAHPVLPDRAVPLVVEVRDPMGGPHQRRAAADRGVRDTGAVLGGAETNLLLQPSGFGKERAGAFVLTCLALRHPAIAATMDGLDDGLADPVVADDPAGGLDSARKRRLADETIAPDVVEQLGLRHDTLTVRHEVPEYLEHLRLDVQRLTGPLQQEPIGIEHEVPEREPHLLMVTRSVRSGGPFPSRPAGWGTVCVRLRTHPACGRLRTPLV